MFRMGSNVKVREEEEGGEDVMGGEAMGGVREAGGDAVSEEEEEEEEEEDIFASLRTIADPEFPDCSLEQLNVVTLDGVKVKRVNRRYYPHYHHSTPPSQHELLSKNTDFWEVDIYISPTSHNQATAKSDVISRGEPVHRRWLRGQPMVADLAAAGEFDDALATLHRRIGLINSAPMRSHFSNAYQAANASLIGLPSTTPLTVPLIEVGSLKDPNPLPMRLYNVPFLLEIMRAAHKHVTAGKFQDAQTSFQQLLQAIPLAVAATAEDEVQLHEFIAVCREYVTAMRLECTRLLLPDDEASAARNVELAAYFAHCKLQPAHLFLVLRRCIGVALKAQNHLTTAALCRRLIQGNIKGPEEEIVKAKKVLVFAEQKGTDKHTIDFDPSEKDQLTICCISQTRIPLSAPTVRCPFCASTAFAEHRNKLCQTCDLSQLGTRVVGLQLRPIA